MEALRIIFSADLALRRYRCFIAEAAAAIKDLKQTDE